MTDLELSFDDTSIDANFFPDNLKTPSTNLIDGIPLGVVQKNFGS